MTEIESEVVLTALRLLEIKTDQKSYSFTEIEIRVLLMALRLWELKTADQPHDQPEDQEAEDFLLACSGVVPIQSHLNQGVINNLVKAIMEIQS